jgi:formate hydrogenlyase transcriptional activator
VIELFEAARTATRGDALAKQWLGALRETGVRGLRLGRRDETWSAGSCRGNAKRIAGPDATWVELFGEPALSRADELLLAELAAIMAIWFRRMQRFAGVSRRAHRERSILRRRVAELEGEDLGLLGSSAPMREVRRLLRLVAPHSTTVLIAGETGTGKELAARAIHRLSLRAGPFAAINCGALPAGLLEAELFGHVRGAFTGAVAPREGALLAAGSGTVFLDEIAELSADAQAKLLRVLQEREVVPLGSERPRPMRARVIVATHKNLEREVAAGRFREDLYYRISTFPIRTPALRERPEDISVLAEARLASLASRAGRTAPRLTREVRAALARFAWPGNVRQLENEIERALLLSTGEALEWTAPAAPSPSIGLDASVVRAIEDALRACGGRIYGAHGAAARLGLKPSTLQTKMKKHGIERTHFTRPE